MKTEQILLEISKSHPDLDAWGLAGDHLRRRNEVTTRTPIDPTEFDICLEWLALCGMRKTVNMGLGTSYGLKHVIEQWAGRYVSNGAFIAAVIYLRIPFKRHPDNPNIKLAISSKRIPGEGHGDPRGGYRQCA